MYPYPPPPPGTGPLMALLVVGMLILIAWGIGYGVTGRMNPVDWIKICSLEEDDCPDDSKLDEAICACLDDDDKVVLEGKLLSSEPKCSLDEDDCNEDCPLDEDKCECICSDGTVTKKGEITDESGNSVNTSGARDIKATATKAEWDDMKEMYDLYPNTFTIAAAWYIVFNQDIRDYSRYIALVYNEMKDDNASEEEIAEVLADIAEGYMDKFGASGSDFFSKYKDFVTEIRKGAIIPFAIRGRLKAGIDISTSLDWEAPDKVVNLSYDKEDNPLFQEDEKLEYMTYQGVIMPERKDWNETDEEWGDPINRKVGEKPVEWMRRVVLIVMGGYPGYEVWFGDEENLTDAKWDPIIGNKVRLDPTIIDALEDYLKDLCDEGHWFDLRSKLSGLYDCETSKLVGLPSYTSTPSHELDPFSLVPTKWHDIAMGGLKSSNAAWMKDIVEKLVNLRPGAKLSNYPDQLLQKFFSHYPKYGETFQQHYWEVNSKWNGKLNALSPQIVTKSFLDEVVKEIISVFKGKSLSSCSWPFHCGPARTTYDDYYNPGEPTPPCNYTCQGLSTTHCYPHESKTTRLGVTFVGAGMTPVTEYEKTNNWNGPSRSCNWQERWDRIVDSPLINVNSETVSW